MNTIDPMVLFGGGTTHSWTDPSGKKYSYNWGFGRVTDVTDTDIHNLLDLVDKQKKDKEKEVVEYIRRDVAMTNAILKTILNSHYGLGSSKRAMNFEIEKVIFSPPATIVIWADGIKTIVKAQGNDVFDPEKGLALCFMKRALGNKGHYYETVKKYAGQYQFVEEVANTELSSMNELAALMEKARNRTWKIFIKTYNNDGECVGIGKYPREYSRKCDAVRIANQRFGNNFYTRPIVTQDDTIE